MKNDISMTDGKCFAGNSVAFLIAAVVAVFLAIGCSVTSYTDTRLVSIVIAPGNASIAGGTNLQLTATGIYSDASTVDLTASVMWTSSDPVVTISATGLATAGAVSASIPCTIQAVGPGGLIGSTVLTVKFLTLVSLAITPSAPPLLDQGLVVQFTATGTYDDLSTQNLSSSVTWTSSNPSVADIDASGLATGRTEGATSVAAVWSGVTSNPVTLQVSGMVLQSIALYPPDQLIYHAEKVYFIATGTVSDGVSSAARDVTQSVVWTSSDAAVAAIGVYSPAGGGMIVQGLSVGTATITATRGLVSQSTSVTVIADPSGH